MRHLLSLLLALVLAPIVYVCAGFSAAWFAQATTDTDIVKALLGLAAALVAGGLYAVLVMARLSPVGPVLAGLLYLGVGGWAIADPRGFDGTVPGTLLAVNGVLHAAVPFGTSLLAVPLLATIFSPRRWRRTAHPVAASVDAAPVYPPAPGSAAPTYGTPAGAAPAYEPTRTDQHSVVSAGYAEAPTTRDTLSFVPPLYQPPTYADATTGLTPASPAKPTPSEDDDPNRAGFR
ncbi:MAG: hypothetical protein QOE61_1748 [Micromonosporaceae bacterium]|nr:hypothetical protein [Micromonosporaceae bacterium]